MTSVALEHLASMFEAKNAEKAMREAMEKAAAAAAKAAGGGQGGQQGAQGAQGQQGAQGAQGVQGQQGAQQQQQVQQMSSTEMSQRFRQNGAAGQQWSGFQDQRPVDPAAQTQSANNNADPSQLYKNLTAQGQQGTARPVDPADAAAAATATTTATRPGAQGTPAPTTPESQRGSGTKRQFRGFQETDVNKLRDQLPQNAKHLAQQFIDSGKKHNLDPLALAAIAKHETGNFTSSAFKNKNNAMGISNKKGPVRMSSAEASIEQMAKGLANPKGYYKKAETIGQVGQVYAPVGAANDPRGLNGVWPRAVARNMDELVRNVRGA